MRVEMFFGRKGCLIAVTGVLWRLFAETAIPDVSFRERLKGSIVHAANN